MADGRTRIRWVSFALVGAMVFGLVLIFSPTGSDTDTASRSLVPVAVESGSRPRASAGVGSVTARETESAEALASALATADPIRRMSLVVGLARELGASEPYVALALAESIDDADLRRFYAAAVVETVAKAGPAELAAFLNSADLGQVSMVSETLAELARNQPQFLMTLVDRFPPNARDTLATLAVRTMAESDPLAALRAIDAMSPGSRRDMMLSSTATAYATQDPEGALLWLESLSPPTSQALQGVIRGLAAVDFERALDLLSASLAEPVDGDDAMALTPLAWTLIATAGSGADAGRVLDRVMESGLSNVQQTSAVVSAASRWVRDDAEAALAWAASHSADLDANTWNNLAGNLTRADPAAAIEVLDAIAEDQRGQWISGIVVGLAPTDLDAAFEFVESQRGQPGFDSGLNAALRSWARTDPVAAARRLAEEGQSIARPATSGAIAAAWAERDETAAARWAADLVDPRQRTEAIREVAAVWTAKDADAARQWVLGLEPGPARDRGLGGYLRARAADGPIDTGLLSAFSDDMVRQQALANALLEFGMREPDEARRLMNTYITEPRLLQMTGSLLDRSGENTNATVIVY